MRYCERISPEDFDSAASRRYTAQCVEQLVRSKQYRSYRRHVRHTERLYLTWVLGPVGLVLVLYFHTVLVATDGDLSFTESLSELVYPLELTLPYLTVFLLLFVVPCLVVAPFAGLFTRPSVPDTVKTFALFSAAHVAMVSSGSELLHRPPYLDTSPSTGSLWRRGAYGDALRVTAVRVAPLQGLLLAGWVVAAWQRTFWKRAWHPPLPFVTVPLGAGIFGLLSSRFASLLVLQLFPDESTADTVVFATHFWAVSDPGTMASAWSRAVRAVLRNQWVEVRGFLTGRVPFELRDVDACFTLYGAALVLAVVYASLLFVGPLLELLVSAVVDLLPTHPTKWLLTLTTAAGGAFYLLQSNDATGVVGGAALSLAVLLLLYNGFRA